MKKTIKLTLFSAVVAGFFASIASAQTVIAPISCTLSNESSSGTGSTVGPWLDLNPPVRWWDGSGIISNATSIADGALIPAVWPEHQWGWSSARTARVRDTADAPNIKGNAILTFEFDFPAIIDGLVLWNLGESAGGSLDQGDRAINTAAIWYSTNGVDFIDTSEIFTFTREGTNDVPVAAQVKTLAAPLSDVTHIRMDCRNFGTVQSIFGFSELRFTGDRPGIPKFIANPIVKDNGMYGSDYAPLSQTLDGSATNAAGDTMFYDKVGGPDWLVVATNGALSGIPDVSGTNTFSINAIAGEFSAAGSLQIVVDALGNPPVFTSDPIIKADGAFEEDYAALSQSLTNNATDLDGDTLTFLKSGGPDWLNVASNGTLSGVCGTIGTNSFNVTVEDGNGNSDTAALLIFVTTPPTQAPDPDGLFAHWAMNEGAGGTTADQSDNSYDGVIVGATWVTGGTGPRATYLSFDGVDDHMNPSLTLPLMTTSNDFTWAVWANNQLDPALGSQKNGIIAGNRKNGSGADFTPREFIKFTPNNFEWRPDDKADGTSYTALAVSNWVHLAVVKTGDNLQVFYNGVAANANTVNGFTNAMPFFVGGEPGQSGNEHFNGWVDDVRLYDYALNTAEILYVMNDGGDVDLSSEITDYSFDPSATSSLSFQGAPISDYVIKSTGNLAFSGYATVTPAAVTVGSLNGDVITTDSTGAATAEFLETAPAKFYKIESAP